MGIEIRTRVLRYYVFLVLLQGVDAWTTTNTTEKRLASCEMYCYQRMCKISWTQHVKNSEILETMKKQKLVIQRLVVR